MEICAVTLIVLRCSDIERSRAYYECLGLRFVREQHGSGPEHYSTRVGTLVLELYPRKDAETSGLRIGFSVPELTATLQRLERSGSIVHRVAREATPPYALLRDPDGHWIELSQAMDTEGEQRRH